MGEQTTQAPPPESVSPAPQDVVRQQQETENPDMPAPIAYTQAQLDAAAEEIKMLTPEGWIEMTTYIHSLEDVGSLSEAPGIAWTTLYSEKTGGQMNVTSRAMTTKAAIEDMFESVRYVMSWQKHMKWSTQKSYKKAPVSNTAAPTSTAAPAPTSIPTPAPAPSPAPSPAPQQPVYGPVEGSGIEKFTVASINHAISKNGRHYVLVKTVEPAFGKFGVNAWKEVVPVDFEAWQVDAEFLPPPEMAFCLVDTMNKPKKVTAFNAE